MNRIAGRSKILLLLVLVLIVGMGLFFAEYSYSADEWVAFQGSPHVYQNGKFAMGVITDSNGKLLLDLTDGSYAADSDIRRATLHWVGDAEGKISVPFLNEYATQLMNYNPVAGMYAYGDTVREVELTLDAGVQAAALEALGSYKGTVAVYNYMTGELLCAVSTPTYDPCDVPDVEADETGALTGVYVNRFVQASYTPGSIFKVATLAAALEARPDLEDMEFSCTARYLAGDAVVTCERAHGRQNLKQMFANSCNCAFAKIAQTLGAEELDRCIRQFRFMDRMTLDGMTTAKGNLEVVNESMEILAWSGVGQGKDLVNPCAYLSFIGSIARGGQGVQMHVVRRISVGESVTYRASARLLPRVVSEDTAQKLRQFMRSNVQQVYGDENFPGLDVCAKTGTAEVGGGRKPNAMFAGFVENEEYPLAFIVAVEDAGYGAKVCVPIMKDVLKACTEAMDS